MTSVIVFVVAIAAAAEVSAARRAAAPAFLLEVMSLQPPSLHSCLYVDIPSFYSPPPLYM